MLILERANNIFLFKIYRIIVSDNKNSRIRVERTKLKSKLTEMSLTILMKLCIFVELQKIFEKYFFYRQRSSLKGENYPLKVRVDLTY